ncbi:ATP-dependent helicase/nuclease subunit A [Muribaculaceae bacterium]|uniref:PD-(D/E)XK nuclease family protein n=1 Tax=Bacteroides acidifaciens TaxID=85831 RepID=UPI0014350157|nr:PD-(D/E)XK nuclease family protein [Bacteroides acidifaciens]GFI05909.1 ATP-dependent helicase/nuclease subunit A [Muribaculaceae bacterium]
MDNIPHIKKLSDYIKPISSLSPSSFLNSERGCVLHTILSKSVPFSLKTPPTSKAILGTISHKMLELRRLGFINSRQEFKLKWKKLIQEKESEIKVQFPTLRNIILADFQLCNEIWNIAQTISAEVVSGSQYEQSNPFGPEKKVKLGNILIGYIDSASSFGDGAEIIDYKTGKVHDEFGNIKEEYISQLSLYALMFEETFGIKVHRLAIIDRDSTYHTVNRLPIDKETILLNAQNLINEINDKLTSELIDICSANVNCKFCNCRHLCPSFLEGADSSQIVKGKLVSVPNKNVAIVETSSGNQVINGLDTLDIELHQYLNKTIVFLNLFVRDKLPLTICSNSLIFIED